MNPSSEDAKGAVGLLFALGVVLILILGVPMILGRLQTQVDTAPTTYCSTMILAKGIVYNTTTDLWQVTGIPMWMILGTICMMVFLGAMVWIKK